MLDEELNSSNNPELSRPNGSGERYRSKFFASKLGRHEKSPNVKSPNEKSLNLKILMGKVLTRKVLNLKIGLGVVLTARHRHRA